jgi:hypothetical protein
MADDVPTPTKAVYLFFEFTALGCALEAIPAFEHGSWRLGTLLIVLAAIFLILGVSIALKVPWAINLIKTTWGKLPSQKALSAALKENAELKARLAQTKMNLPDSRTPEPTLGSVAKTTETVEEPTLSSLMNGDFPSLMKLHGKPVITFTEAVRWKSRMFSMWTSGLDQSSLAYISRHPQWRFR